MKRVSQLLLLVLSIGLMMGSDSQAVRFEKLGGKIMCTCSCGQMLLKCNHVGCPNSSRMIAQLHDQLGDGRTGGGATTPAGIATTGTTDGPNTATAKSDEDVLNFFRTEWGVTAVVEPSQHGFELLAWILPFVGLIVGTILLIIVVTKWKRRPVQVNAADAVRDPHMDALRARARQETEI
jgi:cytochrome c-type biogenesis protein CcmH